MENMYLLEFDIVVDNFRQTRLVNGNFPILQSLNLTFICVYTDHMISSLSQTCGCDQSDITHAYNAYFHDTYPLCIN